MKKNFLMTVLFLTGTLLFTGCGETQTKENDAQNNASYSQQENENNQTTDDDDTYLPPNNSDSETFSKLNTTDLDGNTIDASIFAKNKITLVNAWNIGCTPCINELPELEKINTEFADKGAAFIGLYNDFGMGISDDEMNDIKEILKNANATFTQLRVDGTLADDDMISNMMVFPTTYVVNSEGKIIDTIEGSNNYEGWKAVIESYLENID